MPAKYVEYRTPAEIAANAGRVLTYEQLLQQVWGAAGDDPDNPTYIFNEFRVGYRMAGGAGRSGLICRRRSPLGGSRVSENGGV